MHAQHHERVVARACSQATFKMATVVAPPPDAVDRAAGWGGDCGCFNDVSHEAFLNILSRVPLHSRLAITEFVCKSFRTLRFEPELFEHIGLHDSGKALKYQLLAATNVSRFNSVCCPAAHFANLLLAKADRVKSVSFDGHVRRRALFHT